MRSLGLIAVLLVVEGCAVVANDDGPTNNGSARVAAGPEVFPNSVKYSDKGLKPATGRSGSAQMMARALLGRDGSTELELSTGDLELTVAGAGILARTQVKRLAGDGSYVVVTNDSPATAYARYLYQELDRGQPLRVQANITGIDGARTDVVAVTETVKRRPDVAVHSVVAPPRALLGGMVPISAILREVNGDVGARADCRLAVDGVDVDAAEGIWVDAGGSVSCAFEHEFAAAGVHTVSVSIANVAPRDDDFSNNATSADVTIDLPLVELPATTSINAWSQHVVSDGRTTWWYASGAFAGESVTSDRRDEQFAGLSLTTPTLFNFPVTVSFADQSDGVSLGAVDGLVLPATLFVDKSKDGKGENKTWYSCGIASLDANSTINVCSGASAGKDGVLVPFTNAYSMRSGGDATYYSRQAGALWGGGVFINAWSRHAKPLALGNTYSGTLSANDGTRSIHGGGSATLSPFGGTRSGPNACRPYAWPDRSIGRICEFFNEVVSGRSGNATFTK